MPGIVGIITKMPPDQVLPEFARMVRSLRHEAFYVGGTLVDKDLGVYVGWVARRGSFSDGMPLRNEHGDLSLVFSGEEYPEPGICERLKSRGHQLDSSGCSYLVHLCEEEPTFPASLNGRFHGLVIDSRQGTAVLFNDRYGMHPIYYRKSGDAFYFAAEAKGILAVRPELRRLDPRALGEFVACGCTLEGRSLFEGVRVLPGGSRWVFRNGRLAKEEAYFRAAEWENQGQLEPEPFYRQLREVFSRNLPRYFAGPERVAMSITGGLDTRMVMAWQKSEPRSLACYTYGGPLRECKDVTVGRDVARMCRQPHQVIAVGKEFLAKFGDYAERAVYLSDGCIDVSRAPDLYLNERARTIAPVRMTGLYGGEILRLVRTFKPEAPLPGMFQPELLSYVRKAGQTYGSAINEHPVSFAAFKQAPWHQRGVLGLEQTQLSVRTPFLDNDLVQVAFRAPLPSLTGDEVCWRLVGDGNRSLLRIPTDRGLAADGARFLSGLRHTWLEFLFKAEYAYDMGMPQWVAQVDGALASLRLERLFLGRHKIFHFRTWYRDALAGYVREMLLDPRSLSRPYIRAQALESMVAGHLKGNSNYTNEIHKALTLEILHRVLLDSSTASAMNQRVELQAVAGARQ